MRLTALRWIAAVSVWLAWSAAEGARRPRYGGVLRVAVQGDGANGSTAEQINAQVFETWVRVDDRGAVQPGLALSWIHEPARKRWVFTPRAGVVLHNGSAWEPGPLVLADDQPIEQILRNLARPSSAVVVRGTDGSAVGTGPFRIAAAATGKSVTLAAHEGYWGGRPFLDGVEISLGRGQREQLLDFDLGKVDVIEAPIGEIRRLRQRGIAVAVSAATEVVALSGGGEKLALAVDRQAIHNVLLQRQGEISGALLPQWLSGWAFLFPGVRDVARARQMGPAAQTLTFAYDRQDPMLRAIAERVVLNAAEVGLTLKPVNGGAADVRLLVLPVTTPDARMALADMAAVLKVPVPAAGGYEGERQLMETGRLTPLFHLPVAQALSPRVRQWSAGRWRLADVWIEEKQ